MTSYRYFDDITVFSTVDLEPAGSSRSRPPSICATPLSQSEFEEARRWPAKKATRSSGSTSDSATSSSVYPQFSQFTVKDDPRDPSRRSPELPGGQARPQLSASPGRPDDAARSRLRLPRPEPRPGRAVVRRRSTAAQPIGISQTDRHQGIPACSFPRSAPALLVAAMGLASVMPSARPPSVFPATDLADPPAQEVTTEFLISESGGTEPRKGTAWKVHFARGVHKGLYITGAWFKRDLGEDWIKVLNDARIAELFVPYHSRATSATSI